MPMLAVMLIEIVLGSSSSFSGILLIAAGGLASNKCDLYSPSARLGGALNMIRMVCPAPGTSVTWRGEYLTTSSANFSPGSGVETSWNSPVWVILFLTRLILYVACTWLVFTISTWAVRCLSVMTTRLGYTMRSAAASAAVLQAKIRTEAATATAKARLAMHFMAFLLFHRNGKSAAVGAVLLNAVHRQSPPHHEWQLPACRNIPSDGD